jgi:hypothetical protein
VERQLPQRIQHFGYMCTQSTMPLLLGYYCEHTNQKVMDYHPKEYREYSKTQKTQCPQGDLHVQYL